MNKKEMPKKFYWHAMTSSGGTLSLEVDVREIKKKNEKVDAVAMALLQAVKFMKKKGYIPSDAKLMSSSDVADKYGKTRQYWEKLLNEGKILYKETAAGRITTDLWVEGYLGNPEKVNGYVKAVRDVLGHIKNSDRKMGSVLCPLCKKTRFEFSTNTNGNTNGICRACGFQVHTME